MVADTSIKNPKWNDFGEKITDEDQYYYYNDTVVYTKVKSMLQ
jgi:hypothetical protein